MKNRKKTQHRSADLSQLAKRAVASAKERRAVVLSEAELGAATGGAGHIGGITSGAVLEPNQGEAL